MCYEIDTFLQQYDSSGENIGPGTLDEITGYNWGRPLCWIDQHIVAYVHNRLESDDYRATHGTSPIPSDIVKVDIRNPETTERIPFDGFSVNESGEVGGELFYDSVWQCFISKDNDKGLCIATANGEVILQDESLGNWQYDAEQRRLYQYEHNTNSIEVMSLIS